MSSDDLGVPQDVESLRRLVLMLQKQLAAAGVDPTVASISLDDAKEKLQGALKKLLDGDESAQPEYDKWDRIVSCHPEHLAEQERLENEWEEKIQKLCLEALAELRDIVPVDIKHMTPESLAKLPGMHKSKVNRLMRKKALWLIYEPTERIAKTHAADLMIKYSSSGLDFREIKALYAVAPVVMENDSDGRKAEWRVQLKRKLKEYSDKHEEGTLRPNQMIHPDYSEKKIVNRRKSTGSIGGTIGGLGGKHALASMLEGRLKPMTGDRTERTKQNKSMNNKLGGLAASLEGQLLKRGPPRNLENDPNKKLSNKLGGLAAALEGQLLKRGSPRVAKNDLTGDASSGVQTVGQASEKARVAASSQNQLLPTKPRSSSNIDILAASLEGKLFKTMKTPPVKRENVHKKGSSVNGKIQGLAKSLEGVLLKGRQNPRSKAASMQSRTDVHGECSRITKSNFESGITRGEDHEKLEQSAPNMTASAMSLVESPSKSAVARKKPPSMPSSPIKVNASLSKEALLSQQLAAALAALEKLEKQKSSMAAKTHRSENLTNEDTHAGNVQQTRSENDEDKENSSSRSVGAKSVPVTKGPVPKPLDSLQKPQSEQINNNCEKELGTPPRNKIVEEETVSPEHKEFSSSAVVNGPREEIETTKVLDKEVVGATTDTMRKEPQDSRATVTSSLPQSADGIVVSKHLAAVLVSLLIYVLFTAVYSDSPSSQRADHLKKWYPTCQREVIVPEGVTEVPDMALFGCQHIQRLQLPRTLKSIGKNAFHGCTSLESVDVPLQVDTIKDGAFHGCSKLKRVALPRTAKVGKNVFKGCKNVALTALDVEEPDQPVNNVASDQPPADIEQSGKREQHEQREHEQASTSSQKPVGKPQLHSIKRSCNARGGYGAGCVYTAEGAVLLNMEKNDGGTNSNAEVRYATPDPEAIAAAAKARRDQNARSKYKKWQEEKKKTAKNEATGEL